MNDPIEKSKKTRNAHVDDLFARTTGGTLIDLPAHQEEPITQTPQPLAEGPWSQIHEAPTLTSRGALHQRWSAQLQRRKEKYQKLSIIAILALFVVGAFLLRSTWRGQERDRARRAAVLSDRIEHHRQQTGLRLNVDRLKMEADNFLLAPSVADENPSEERSVEIMAGLALGQEAIESRPWRGSKLSPRYADAQVLYQVQAERLIERREDNREEEFVNAFIQNAKQAGYEVKVLKNLDVQVVKAPRRKRGVTSTESYSQSGE